MKEPRYVQACNPITKRYVKIDRLRGAIVSHKSTKGAYKNIEIVGERYDKE
jgi:hypothetical protein